MPHFNLMSESEEEPSQKMIKPLVTKYRKLLSGDLEYTINVKIADGEDWEVIKTFTQILAHRKKVHKKHPLLNIPIISQSGDANDKVIQDKRMFEIQRYLDYLLKSKTAYKALLDLIGFKNNSRASVKRPKVNVVEPESSDIPLDSMSSSEQQELKDTNKSHLTINYDEDESSVQILGQSFREDDALFLSNKKYKDYDSDDDNF